jgi:hypothetical protein
MVGDGWVMARLSRGFVVTQPLGQLSSVSPAVTDECWWIFRPPPVISLSLPLPPASFLFGCYPVFWFHFLKVH